MVRQFANRIHFIHLRSTQRHAAANFYEVNHPAGDGDMYAVLRELILPMRPYHSHQMLDDLPKKTTPATPPSAACAGWPSCAARNRASAAAWALRNIHVLTRSLHCFYAR